MSLSLSFGELTIEGASRAGEETWFRIHPPGLAFDAGRGAPQLSGAADLFLSHGHLDHALGVPYVLSLRAVQNMGATRIYCPAPLRGELAGFIDSAGRLEGVEYEFELHGLAPGDRVAVARDLLIEAFSTDHVGASLGFHLFRAKHLLRAELVGKDADELVALKDQGVEIDHLEEDLWLSYCGDTGAAVFDLEPRILTSRVLLIECTFFGKESSDRAERFKHIHLDDLVERLDVIQNEELVLHHTSRRYRRLEMQQAIEQHLAHASARIHLFCQ